MPPQEDPAVTTTHKAIIFEDVAISFEGLTILDGVSLELKRGETKALLGVAGSGKSTIMKLCLGLIKPDSGRIYVLGHDITQMREEELFDLRSHIGIVFQESALFDSLTVRDNVAFRLMEEKIPEQEIEQRVREALRFVELEHTVDMLEKCNWNQTEAAERFHIPLSTLNQKIKRLSIEIKKRSKDQALNN